MKKISIVSLAIVALWTGTFAQQRVLTAADYDRAVKMLSFNTSPLVDRGSVNPTFLPDGRFWYRALTPTGAEYVLVDPANGSRKTAAKVSGLGIPRPEGGSGGSGNPFAIVSPDGKR